MATVATPILSPPLAFLMPAQNMLAGIGDDAFIEWER